MFELRTYTLAALTLVLACSCEKSDDIAPDNGSTAKVLPKDALPGKFSISDTKKVHFSKGNLYYDGSSWNFEANQYDYRTYAEKSAVINGKSTTTQSGHWGLFGWSTIRTNYGMETSQNTSDYYGTFWDWGRVAINGAQRDTWRTLSNDEWNYLLKTRTMTNGKARYSLNITYGNVKGMVLYPDDYNQGPVSSTVTTLPDGVVFLPAAGHRNGGTVHYAGNFGHYWSSSAYNEGRAYYVLFGSGYVDPGRDFSRNLGYSVRLVTDAN